MSFEDGDRERAIRTETDVAWLKKSHTKRLELLEKEDRAIHIRINNVIKFVIGTIVTISGAVVAAAKIITSKGSP